MELPADLARHLASVALGAADAERRVREELAARGESFPAVLALGKAAAAMARGAEGFVPPTAPRLLLRPHSSLPLLDPRWEELSGGHPLPDAASVAAGERLRDWLAGLRPFPKGSGRLLALVSGGASACVELPAPGLALADLVAAHAALLASGLPIAAVNAARKRLSRLKGGGALRSTPVPVLALLLSDVPDDDPATIASGPFAADPPDCLPKAPVETVVVGSVADAVAAVLADLRARGFATSAGRLAGEAAAAGRELVSAGRRLGGERSALALGGETVVRLPAGPVGHGGRNQELALAAARELAGSRDEAVLALATDGVDGPTAAAGAVVDGGTWGTVRRAGLDPDAALAGHDSGTALAAAGALVATGPTGTNVADVALYLRLAGEAAEAPPADCDSIAKNHS